MPLPSDASTTEVGQRSDSPRSSERPVDGDSVEQLCDSPIAPESSASVSGETCSKVDSSAEDPYDNCRFRNGRNEKSIHHGGVAELAGMFDQWSNWKFYRAFGWENWHLLVDSQYRISYLSEELREYYKEHPEEARGPTANHKRPAGQPLMEDKLETIKADLRKELDDYCKKIQDTRKTTTALVTYAVANHCKPVKRCGYVKANEQQYATHPEQWRITNEWMTYNKNLDPEAGIILRTPEDLISLADPPPYWVIQTSADISRRYNQWFKPASQSKDNYIPNPFLTFIFRTIHVIAAALLLLVPAGMLYLAELDKGQVFAIIGVSTIVFCATVSAKTRLDTTTTALAGCAYLAFCGAFAVATGNISL
ncbi:hypothetical protein QC762_204965 [Podospora pseudocomata]|uniref:DUF6594 domain-containing protein n=1 Tax=Podospora pseudocomata TaxID=2093779 RepID=A0ABR0GLA6_9PEZI|nr:hypothetical protein QC762_204965 [Podospora pseudocomata]